jgi:subtilase family serine protease
MAGGSRTAVRVVGVLAAAAALIPAPAARAALTRVGRESAAAGASVLGPVAPGTRLHVTVTLKPRSPAALAAYAKAVSTPGSSDYRHYLTPGQFGRRFGATAAQVSTVRDSLRAHGLRPETAGPSSLSISVVASAAQLQRAFSVALSRLALPNRRSAIAASAAPAFDTRAAGVVQSVIGLNTISAPRPLLVRGARAPVARPLAQPAVSTGGPQPCAAAQAAAPSQSAYTADQIASAYGFSGLYGAANQGSGVTVAVYELEPSDASDIAAYQSCYATHAAISYVSVDGGAGSGPGTGEAALDIENLIGLAPLANVLVYQGPNANSGDPGSGPYDTFRAIINQDRAQVVTVSWGQCEAALGQPDAIAESTLFMQAAVQGQSIVAAAGDSGSADCDTGGALPQTQLAVDDPSSQPYVTGVGGTSLKSIGPRPVESVWNSGGSVVGDLMQPGAGGGGASGFWTMPAAQLDSAPALGVRTVAADGSTCGNPGGRCRQVPDVAASADPSNGYLIYWNGSGAVAGQPSGWQGIGGTSGAAPLWAALLTLADSSPACAGSPLGYANPALYRAAAGDYAGNFNDITSGNNDFTGTNGGRYGAGPGYDPASGLGSPDAAALAAGLCADTLRITSPGPQRSALHATVSLRLRAHDVPGTSLTYAATGLVPGLKLDTATGRITGQARRTGTFAVRVTAQDAQAARSTATFTWTIGAAPRLSGVALTAKAGGRPELAFTVTAGRDAPLLSTLVIGLPRSLRLASRHGVRVAGSALTTSRMRFGARVGRGNHLTISLRQPSAGVRVTLAPPSLGVPARVPNTAQRRARRLVLVLSVVDAAAGRSALSAKLPTG